MIFYGQHNWYWIFKSSFFKIQLIQRIALKQQYDNLGAIHKWRPQKIGFSNLPPPFPLYHEIPDRLGPASTFVEINPRRIN